MWSGSVLYVKWRKLRGISLKNNQTCPAPASSCSAAAPASRLHLLAPFCIPPWGALCRTAGTQTPSNRCKQNKVKKMRVGRRGVWNRSCPRGWGRCRGCAPCPAHDAVRILISTTTAAASSRKRLLSANGDSCSLYIFKRQHFSTKINPCIFF